MMKSVFLELSLFLKMSM